MRRRSSLNNCLVLNEHEDALDENSLRRLHYDNYSFFNTKVLFSSTT